MSAIGAWGFTCGGGLVVYLNLKHMVEVRAWMDHSQSVLNNLQTASQSVDRIIYTMQLHETKHDFDELRSAQSAAAAMEVGGLNITHLVQDTPSQSRHADSLLVAVREFSAALDANKDTTLIPEQEIREGRNAIGLLQEEERRLCKQRSDKEQQNVVKSILLIGAGARHHGPRHPGNSHGLLREVAAMKYVRAVPGAGVNASEYRQHRARRKKILTRRFTVAAAKTVWASDMTDISTQ